LGRGYPHNFSIIFKTFIYKLIKDYKMQQKAINLLKATQRPNIEALIAFLQENAYFTSPSSHAFHGSHESGLLKHSYFVYSLYKLRCKKYNLPVPEDSIIICGLLHDICKLGLYIKENDSYRYNKAIAAEGHALRSIKLISQFITLTPLEIDIIKFHMGMYGTKEMFPWGEYSLEELKIAFNNKSCKMFYFCDDTSANYIEPNKE
jgi:hypothetical protein